MRTNHFFIWEAVVRQEENKELNEYQKEQLGQLLNFGDDEDEEIHYIDGSARPSKNWYEIANELAKKFVKGRLKTYAAHTDLVSEGWQKLRDSILENAENLSIPNNINLPIEVIDEEIRHHLEIQESMDWLLGLGQEEKLSLSNPDQNFRIEGLISALKEKIKSIEYFQLSIQQITSDFVELREKDEIIFHNNMIRELDLDSAKENIASKLLKHLT